MEPSESDKHLTHELPVMAIASDSETLVAVAFMVGAALVVTYLGYRI